MVSLQPRYRSRGGFQTAPSYEIEKLWWDCSVSSWTLHSTVAYSLKVGSFESMSDIVVPGFQARRAKGQTFFNDMTRTLRESSITSVGNGLHEKSIVGPITCGGVQRYAETRFNGSQFAATLSGFYNSADALLPVSPLIPSRDILDLQTEVSTACLARRGTSDSNLYESLAEIRQTLSLLRRPFTSLDGILARASRPSERARGAAASWLTYRYGILPIVRDVSGILSGLRKKVGNVRKTVRAQGQIGQNALTTHSASVASQSSSTLTFSKQTTDSVSVRAMSLDEYVVDLYDNIGFSTKGLVTLPWELIPYSFVADWFANIGDFLNALVPLPGVKQLGSALTTQHDIICNWNPIGTTVNANRTLLRPISGSCLASVRSRTRTSLSAPSVVIRSDFRLNEATRLADAVSLLTLRMDRLFRT